MSRHSEYVTNCIAFMASRLPTTTESLLEMREAFHKDLEKHPEPADRFEKELAEIERLLARAKDYEAELTKFEAEREALKSSFRLRVTRYLNGSKSFEYQMRLKKQLRKLADKPI